jgi:hypothetical protein
MVNLCKRGGGRLDAYIAELQGRVSPNL